MSYKILAVLGVLALLWCLKKYETPLGIQTHKTYQRKR